MASKLIDRILDAATWEFSKGGFSGAATKAIAKRADVTEGSLFRLFHSKDRLFERVVARVINDTPAKQVAAHVSLEDGVQFEDGIRNAIRALWDDVSPDAIRLGTYLFLERPLLARRFYVPKIEEAIAIVAHAIDEERKAGRMPKGIKSDVAASMLLGAVARFRLQAACVVPGARKTPLDAVADPRILDDYVDLWLDGLTPKRIKRRKRRPY